MTVVKSVFEKEYKEFKFLIKSKNGLMVQLYKFSYMAEIIN
jgi:hypothetical protein